MPASISTAVSLGRSKRCYLNSSIVSIGLKRDISAISYRISIGIRANVQVTVAPNPKATMMAAAVIMIPMDMIGFLWLK
jgi:hypothetical protein